jgi:hypothetical protein
MHCRFWLRRYIPGALAALLLASSFPSISGAVEKPPLTAIVITAKAELPDDNFAASAVLVLNNIGPAPIGLITNRPTKFTVGHSGWAPGQLGPSMAFGVSH